MDIKTLEYFIKTYQELNISKAAQNLFITQQGLSRVIHTLEKELGVPLFNRNKKGLVPTEFGTSLYQYALHATKDYQNATRELDLLKSSLEGDLRIGVSKGVFPSVQLQKPLAKFKKLYPKTNISIIDEPDLVCETLLLSGDIDCAFLVGNVDNPCLNSIHLYQEPFFAWVCRDHPLAQKSGISLADLVDEPLFISNNQYKLQKLLVQWFHNKNLEPNIKYIINDPITVYCLVSQNEGIALLLKSMLNIFAKSEILLALPITDEDLFWQINLCSVNTHIPKSNEKLFIKYMAEYYKHF